jgi:hypothetical protein
MTSHCPALVSPLHEEPPPAIRAAKVSGSSSIRESGGTAKRPAAAPSLTGTKSGSMPAGLRPRPDRGRTLNRAIAPIGVTGNAQNEQIP